METSKIESQEQLIRIMVGVGYLSIARGSMMMEDKLENVRDLIEIAYSTLIVEALEKISELETEHNQDTLKHNLDGAMKKLIEATRIVAEETKPEQTE